MLDNNGDYRYYGSNPNNYVEFNNELWRIISVGNVKSSVNDTVGETRVKIVKADELIDDNSLSSYSWDSSILNDWSQAELMNELNTFYYNKKSGSCYTYGGASISESCNFTNTGLNSDANNLIGDALYYLGGNSNVYDSYADDYYNFERGNTVWPSEGYTCNDGACPRATRWSGKVGLIYASDYAYATDLNLCTSVGSSYSDSNCVNNNWLAKTNYYWIISSFSNSGALVFVARNCIDEFGGMGYSTTGNIVFQVVYLKSDVVISEGIGTDKKPYQIALAN